MQFSFYVSICLSCKDPLPTPSEFIVLQLLATVLKVIALNVYFISFHCCNLWSCVTPFSQTVFSRRKFLSFVSISKKGFQMHYCAWKDLNTKCINITRIFFSFFFASYDSLDVNIYWKHRCQDFERQLYRLFFITLYFGQ